MKNNLQRGEKPAPGPNIALDFEFDRIYVDTPANTGELQMTLILIR